jgi:hypothetical protein
MVVFLLTNFFTTSLPPRTYGVLPVHQSFSSRNKNFLSVCPSVRLSVCPSVRLSVCHKSWYTDRHPPAIKIIHDKFQPESRYTDCSPPSIKTILPVVDLSVIIGCKCHNFSQTKVDRIEKSPGTPIVLLPQ